ncbi:MAG: type VI secretion system lipoprotein TssJ [Deltaproteobacteria bacterium]|nr:type VI secretion system lipoprotein TssJ [Deltaproteobacteria bacterium]
MKKSLLLSSGIFCLFFLSACAATVPAPPPQYSYSKDAIEIQISADPQLNLYQSSPHTVLLCVHQLSDPNAFNRLTGDTSGIYKLLECAQFDPSVTLSKRYIVQPEQKLTYTQDRAEGTKYVAISTGYYNISKEADVRLYEIPIIEKTVGGSFSKKSTAEPGVLKIELELGPTQIKSVDGK